MADPASVSTDELAALVEVPARRPPLGVVADGLGVRYPGAAEPAIRDVTFRLDPGALLLVVGPSGSGKSTLARAVAGLIDSDASRAGRLEIDGRPADGGPSAEVGVVFQDPGSQLVMDRVEDDVAFGLENRAWPHAAMRMAVGRALAETGLAGFERRRSARLSGGEQQRLALAGVLAPDPGILVLDEPTANLDPDGAAAVFDRIAALRAGRRATIVLIEHHVDPAWPLADLVLALGADGRPIDLGAPAAVLARSGAAMRRAGIWLPTDRAARVRRSVAAPDSGDPVLSMAHVRFAYERGGPVAVHDVSFDIRAGDRVALVGPNGSGKSTLLRLVVGLLRPTAGAVRLLGLDPARMPGRARARAIGFVHQDPELGFLTDTVADEVRLGLASGESDDADALLERLGLPLAVFGRRSPYRLSGGEQRRLSLATALVRRPHLLVLDEPTYGQDRHGHETLVAILREQVADGTALLAATHDARFVHDATDRRIELAEGWVIAADPERLAADPGGLDAAEATA